MVENTEQPPFIARAMMNKNKRVKMSQLGKNAQCAEINGVTEIGRDLRLVFTASKTLFGRLIRWFTRGKVSHVFLEYDSSLWGGRWVAEATIGGVRKVPSYKARHNVIFEYRATKAGNAACNSIAKYFGNAYDYINILIFAWFIIAWRWLKLKIRRPHRSTKAQVCSELVARWVIAYGVPGVSGWNPEYVTPQMIADVCAANSEFFCRVEGEE